MLVSEVILDANKKLLDQIKTSMLDEFYDLHDQYDVETDNFTVPATKLYSEDHIHTMIYHLINSIDKLSNDNNTKSSQIMIALNELLDYFNS